MSDTRPARRRYDNAGRAAQAAANRAAIMQAAVDVLADRGYSGATMTAIASAAGVSVETVYKGFGTKSELVRQVLGAAVVGDDQPVALVDRPEMRAARSEATGAAILAAFAEVSMGILARVGPLLATVLASGRAGEPELRAIARHAGLQRLADLRRVVESVAATGDLRVDLDVDQATDILWTVGSPEVYLQLTVDRGWTGAAYHDWLSRTLALLLLA